MENLDNLDKICGFAKTTLDSLRFFSNQCEQAWEETQMLSFSSSFFSINKIVVCGMGGSSYGVRIVKSLFDHLSFCQIPIELANNYWLPGYVDSHTLVILSSYSGNTEETLACGFQAKKKKAKITGITSGGELAKFFRKNHYPAYIFNPCYNPSAQPRMGVGYMLFGLMGILAKLKKIPLDNQKVQSVAEFLKKNLMELQPEKPSFSNLAKKIAFKLQDKIPIFLIADFLEGASYAVRNMFHETAKQYTEYFVIPELNHHLLEGLSFPLASKKNFFFLFVTSQIYEKRNQRRMEITEEIIKKKGFSYEEIQLNGDFALKQVLEFIQLGLWVTFYLAVLNKVNPAEIPWVNYFKEKLKGGKI